MRSTHSAPRHRRGERFLKGPIPWTWLEAAARQPGQALHVGIVLWQLAGMKGSSCVAINLSRLDGLGVSRYAASRGLKALRTAGLVAFENRQGRTAVVTVLDAPAPVAVDGRPAGA
jgi:DNA-binding transcriptional ArsR family regulator